MAEPARTHVFPTDDALCERCGYPLRGLASEADCPECGLAVAESSPSQRPLIFTGNSLRFKTYWHAVGLFLLQPKQAFRMLAVSGPGLVPELFLFRTSFLASLLLSAIVFIGSAFVVSPRFHIIPLQSALMLFIITAIGINLLSFIEMLGVTAFSRRRGWRVPFPLAQRVCCFASVGWLPGAIIAGVGIWMIQAHGVGRPWFEQLFGLVRVGWLCYAALFIFALLWFETLVWIGVRQVKYANAWPHAAASRPAHVQPAATDRQGPTDD